MDLGWQGRQEQRGPAGPPSAPPSGLWKQRGSRAAGCAGGHASGGQPAARRGSGGVRQPPVSSGVRTEAQDARRPGRVWGRRLVPAEPLAGCVTWGTSLSVSVPQFLTCDMRRLGPPVFGTLLRGSWWGGRGVRARGGDDAGAEGGGPPPGRRGRGLGRSAGSVQALGRPEQARPRGLEGAGQPMPRLRSRKTPGLLARGLGRTKPLPARSLVPAAQGASANVSLQSRPQLQPGHNTRAPEVTPGPPISRPVPAWDEGPGTSLPPGARRGVGVRTFPSASLAGPPGALALVPVCQWLLARGTAVITTQGPPTLPRVRRGCRCRC